MRLSSFHFQFKVLKIITCFSGSFWFKEVMSDPLIRLPRLWQIFNEVRVVVEQQLFDVFDLLWVFSNNFLGFQYIESLAFPFAFVEVCWRMRVTSALVIYVIVAIIKLWSHTWFPRLIFWTIFRLASTVVFRLNLSHLLWAWLILFRLYLTIFKTKRKYFVFLIRLP